MKIKKLIVLFLFASNLVFANTDTVIFKNNITAQGAYNTGNYNNYTIGIRYESILIKNNNKIDLLISGKKTESEPVPGAAYVVRENERYSNLSYSYIKYKLRYLIFSENESSFLRKINYRTTLGCGIGYKFVSNPATYFDISEALMPEYDRYTNNVNITTLRYSTRIKFSYSKYPINFSNISLIQPPIWSSIYVDYTNNMVIRSTTTFDVSINKKLSIGLIDEYIMQTFSSIAINRKPIDNSVNFYLKLNLWRQ
jgi:hypothetical protein